ncbi:hypothetical protein CEXT_339161 [Caerostris extrusa]|uniref:Uncharacterized protein n=1 Tax=Caerostris extrusa TaxID=172846 RepID=A0AAV4SBR7_CAEEX|nr:hypothetical protein CEXT_339161 [Caerostris extrusa]
MKSIITRNHREKSELQMKSFTWLNAKEADMASKLYTASFMRLTMVARNTICCRISAQIFIRLPNLKKGVLTQDEDIPYASFTVIV